MAKSAGNIARVGELLASGVSPRALRYALVSVHYRARLDYSDESLAAAGAAVARLDAAVAALEAYREDRPDDPELPAILDDARSSFGAALDDDLNVSAGLAAVFDLVRELNRRIEAAIALDGRCGSCPGDAPRPGPGPGRAAGRSGRPRRGRARDARPNARRREQLATGRAPTDCATPSQIEGSPWRTRATASAGGASWRAAVADRPRRDDDPARRGGGGHGPGPGTLAGQGPGARRRGRAAADPVEAPGPGAARARHSTGRVTTARARHRTVRDRPADDRTPPRGVAAVRTDRSMTNGPAPVDTGRRPADPDRVAIARSGPRPGGPRPEPPGGRPWDDRRGPPGQGGPDGPADRAIRARVGRGPIGDPVAIARPVQPEDRWDLAEVRALDRVTDPVQAGPSAGGRPGGRGRVARWGRRSARRMRRRRCRRRTFSARTRSSIAGRRPVEEAFVARRPAHRLLVVPQRRQALEKLVLHATSLRLPIVELEGGTLTALAGFDGHQGVALVVEPRQFATLEDILARAAERGEAPFVLALDSLEDPQNVGTLLRSAEAAGVHGVLFPTHRQAPLTPVGGQGLRGRGRASAAGPRRRPRRGPDRPAQPRPAGRRRRGGRATDRATERPARPARDRRRQRGPGPRADRPAPRRPLHADPDAGCGRARSTRPWPGRSSCSRPSPSGTRKGVARRPSRSWPSRMTRTTRRADGLAASADVVQACQGDAATSRGRRSRSGRRVCRGRVGTADRSRRAAADRRDEPAGAEAEGRRPKPKAAAKAQGHGRRQAHDRREAEGGDEAEGHGRPPSPTAAKPKAATKPKATAPPRPPPKPEARQRRPDRLRRDAKAGCEAEGRDQAARPPRSQGDCEAEGGREARDRRSPGRRREVRDRQVPAAPRSPSRRRSPPTPTSDPVPPRNRREAQGRGQGKAMTGVPSVQAPAGHA